MCVCVCVHACMHAFICVCVCAGADLEHNLGGGPRACKRYWPSQRGKVREGVPFSVRSAEALTFFEFKKLI